MRSAVKATLGVLMVPGLLAMSEMVAATTLQPASVGGGSRSAAVDPDAHLEAMAAASSRPTGVVHGRPAHADRSILKDDAQLRAAFAWLGNK